MLPNPIKNLIEELKKLPSIGPRQATRLAFHVSRYNKADLDQFVNTLSDIKNLRPCNLCFLTHQNPTGLCSICTDPKRNTNLIALVEKETDLLSMERAKKFTGRYFILG
jgi:recombination protein RecR